MTGREVVHLDLRGKADERAAELARTLVTDGPEPHLGRLLVIDDAELLMPHYKAFEALCRSRLVATLVCVAVGKPGDDREPLEVPGCLLAGQDSGVFWVPDPAGVDWRVGGSTATRRDGPDGDLASLLEILSVPEVFDRAGELGACVPGGVSNPGLRLAEAVADESDFQLSLLSAIRRLLEPAGPRAQHAAVASVADFCDRPTGGQITLRAGSPLMAAHQQAVDATAATREVVERLPRPSFLVRGRVPVAKRLGEAGTRLEELRERWQTLFDGVPADTELDRTQRKRVEGQGLVIPAPADFDAARVRGAVDRYVSGGLARQVSLGELVDGLKELEVQLSRNGADHTATLDQACPRSLAARLRKPVPFPPPEPWLPAVGFLAAALAGLAPFGLTAGLVTAAVWTALITLTVVRGPGGSRIERIGALVGNGLAAVFGGSVVGGVLGGYAPTAAWGAALAGAAGAVGWAVARSWRWRADRWISELELERIVRAPEELRTAGSLLAAGWPGATERINTADAVIRARVAVGGVEGALRDHAEKLRAAIPPDGQRGAFVSTVPGHLTDLVGAALRPRWRELSAGQAIVLGENARRATANLLADWERHVTEHGPIEPPPFATGNDGRLPPVAAEDLESMALAAAHDADGVMWQLCGAADLGLLDFGPGRPLTALRFAPRAAQPTIGDRLPAETLWVPSPRYAGVLRLVPVRPDMVAPRWPASPEEPDDTAGGSRDE